METLIRTKGEFKPSAVFLLTVPRRFFCCSSSLFVRRWFHTWCLFLSLFVHHLFCLWSLGKVVLRDCGSSWVSSLIVKVNK